MSHEYYHCPQGHILEHISGTNYYCHICDTKHTIHPKHHRKDPFDDVVSVSQTELADICKQWRYKNREWLANHHAT